MKNRVLTLKRTLLAFFAFLLFTPMGWSQDHFIFSYTGPDIINVDPTTCLATLNWGMFTPTVTPADPGSGQAITFFDIDEITGGFSEGDLVPPGTQVSVTYLALDNLGNDSTFTFTIDFVDNTAPVIDMAAIPADVTVTCEVPALPIVNATDNCGGTFATTITDDPMTINYCIGGTLVRTFTASDAAGNVSTATQNITVSANTGPIISAPFLASVADMTVSCDAIPIAPTLTTADISDDCTLTTAVTIVNNGTETTAPGGACPATQILTRTWTLRDDCGLESQHVQTITVEDNSAPIIIAPMTTDTIIQCTGLPSDPETQILNYASNFTVTDNCATVVWSNDYAGLAGGTCAGTGTASVTYTASDGCNSASVTINFEIQDSNPPNITTGAQDIQVACDGMGNTADLTTWLANDGNSVAEDACSPDNLITKSIAVPSDFTTDDPFVALQNAINAGCAAGFVATITVEFTYMDNCGNMSTTDADFSILDSVDPIITSPASNQTVECDGLGNAGDLAGWLAANGNAVGSDGCSGNNVTWRTDPVNPIVNLTCGNTGSVTVDFYVSDACGRENPVPTTATFTIADTTDPTWTATPQPLTLECDGTPDPSGQIATWLGNAGNGIATDACNPGSISYSHNYTGLTNTFCGGAIGSTTVTFTASDGCGNSTSWNVSLTIEDNVDPNWTIAPANLTVECDGTADPGGQIAAWLASVGGGGAATDNCSGVVTDFTNDYSGVSDLCGATGTTVVTFTARDACGRAATLSATLTIEDTTPPSFTQAAQGLNIECDGNTTAAINTWLAANGNAIATEACGTVDWTHNYLSHNVVCAGPGTTTVKFYAEDECGNRDSTSAVITVTDTQNPTIDIAPMNFVAQCDTFEMADYTNWLNSHGGAIASDACSTIDNSSGSTAWTFTDNFLPNCTNTGMYTANFTVMDDCGRTASASANFTIIDDISPTIFPTSTDMTEACGGGDDQAKLEAWIDNKAMAIAIDGCSNFTWVNFDFETNDPFPVQGTFNFGSGNYPTVTPNVCDWSVEVTFRVTDDCNNTSTTTSEFRLEDITDPVLSAIPGDITVDCVAPAPIVPTATDECDANVDIQLVADTVRTCAHSYVVTRTWTATDDCGNTDVGSRIISVIDNTAPTVTALVADVSVQCDNVPVQTLAQVSVADMCDPNPTIVMSADTVLGACVNQYVITRRWTATDACGNEAFAEQVVSVDDNTFPTITGTLPTNIAVSCDMIPDPPVAGTDIVGADNCGLQAFDYLEVSTQGIDPNACSFYTYTLTRTWTAIDLCSNTTVHTQVISVSDTSDPSFTVPGTVTVDCQNVNNLLFTGNVSMVSDDCDNDPDVTFVDNTTVMGSCPFNYTLERTWTVTDACGNDVSQVQIINVQDITDPTFDTTPQDETISCSDEATADAAYADWIAMNGGGVASDLCGTVSWMALEPGSYDINNPATFITAPLGLDAATCPSPAMGIYRTDDVAFVAMDQCGNAIDQVVTFTVTDNTPPVFVDCPVDATFESDSGDCTYAFALNPPLIIDECAGSSSNVNLTVMEAFVSPVPGDDATIVNPITLDIGPLPTNPAIANDPVTLTIDLTNYDGEEATEFFTILGEDGTTLGQTTNSAMQCGNSTTVLTLTGSQINDWASIDGFATITLLPNVTVDPIFAINDICPQGPPTGGGSMASATIDYNSVTPNGLVYEYSIDNGSRVQVSPGTVVPYDFNVGTTLVTYYATDCAGNSSSCSYNITVEDNELPTMNCPSDITVSLPANADCSAGVNVDLVPPTNIYDNCGFQNMYSQVQPQNFNSSLMTFSYNPNYLDYVADDKSFTFFGTGANAVNGTVTFTVRVEGDVEDSDEYFEIYGEDNSLLGTTQAGQPNVSVSPGGVCPVLPISITTISVPVATFNAWALDGEVSITAVSNDNFGSPPPGITGDGISPSCTVFASNTPDGTIDGVSNITVILDYTSVAPTYFATGTSPIGNSIFPVPLVPVTHSFELGVTTVTYQVEDVNGNVNTCSYTITVEDDTAPMALCQGTTIFVSPDGGDYILDPSEIDNGSSDNCGIASMTVSPNTFDCFDIGTTTNVTLTITDDAGNVSSCVAPVNVQSIQLSPSFSIGLCGDENLNLFTNAPAGNYSFAWSGPNGFISFDENPIIPNADASYSGTYVATITGQGGCTATGAVTISINSSPNTPNIEAEDADVCSNEEIEISTQSYSGTGVNYNWYQGVAPTGVLLATTQVPTYSIANPSAGSYSFYVEVEVGPCLSNPSGTVSVDVSDSPVITGITNTPIDCASGDEDMILTAAVSPASTGYIYQWTGPNGFSSAATDATLPDVSSADNGSYTLVIVNADGCSSNPYTHVISVDDQPQTPIVTSLDNQLCEGDLLQLQLVNNPYIGANISYTWNIPNGSPVTTSDASYTINSADVNNTGNYSVSVTVDGCTSDVSGNFAVNVSGIPSAPTASYNGPVCEGTTLQLTTDFVPGATYFWTGPNNFNSTNQNPLIFPVDDTHEGTYFVSLVVNGCPSPSSMPLLVEVNDAPQSVIALNGGPICLGDPAASLELSVSSASAIPGATYTWFDAATNTMVGGPTTSLTVTITDFTAFSAGNNDFYVVADVNGCPSAASVPTTVVFDFTPTNGAFAGNDIFVCDNNSVVLNAQAPTVGTGQWSQTAGPVVVIANPNQSTTAISGLSAGQTYTFAWTLSNGSCTDYAMDDVDVTVDVAVASADAGVDFDLCNATTATLNATGVVGGIVGTWSQPSSQALLGVTIVDPTDPNTLITGLEPGNTYQFIWTLSNSGCGDFSSDIVVLASEGTGGITAFAGADIELCGDEETLLNAAAIPVGIGGTWTSPTPGVTILAANQPNTFVTDLQEGENIFVWTLSNNVCGDFSTDEMVVFFEPAPVANDDSYDISFNGSLDFNVLSNDDLPSGYTITFTNPSNGEIFENNGNFTYNSNLVFVGSDEFVYEICSDICPDECSTATVTLNVGNDATCQIPTIFSPNNDGINDEFFIPCLSTGQFANNEVVIFNQWGDEVFREGPYQNDWQGTYKGEDLPSGTYFFVVDFGDGNTPQDGFLILER